MAHNNQARIIQDLQNANNAQMNAQIGGGVMDQARAPTPLMTGGAPASVLSAANLQQLAHHQTALLQQANPYILSAALQQQQQTQQQNLQQQQQQQMSAAGLNAQLLSLIGRQAGGGMLAQQLALLTQQPFAFNSVQAQQMQALSSLLYNQAAVQAIQQQQQAANQNSAATLAANQNLNSLATIALMHEQQNAALSGSPNNDIGNKRNSAFGEVVSPIQHTINPALLRVAENMHSHDRAMRRQSAPIGVAIGHGLPAHALDPLNQPGTSRQTQQRAAMTGVTPPQVKGGSSLNPEALQEHISRLISENEAILEPSPVLLKRRSYHRHQAVSADHAQQCESPSSKNAQAKRSHSLQLQSSFDSSGLLAQGAGHQLVVGVDGPLLSLNVPSLPSKDNLQCRHCDVIFTNEKYLGAHEFRCSRRPPSDSLKTEVTVVISTASGAEAQRASPVSSPSSGSLGSNPLSLSNASTPTPAGQSKRYPLKKRILAAEKDAQIERQAKIARMDEERMDMERSAVAETHRKYSDQTPLTAAPKMLVSKQLSAPRMNEFSPRVQVTPRQSPAVDVQTMSYQNNKTVAQSVDPASARFLFAQAQGAQVQSSTISNAMVAVAQLQSILAPDMHLSGLDQTRLFKPYTLTVTIPGGQSFDAPRTGRRSRHVTAPTFVCLKRPQPCFFQQKDTKLSMYSNWQQIPVSAMEAKLNLVWMGCCSMKGVRGSNGYWRYTVSDVTMNALRNTHSSFWATSKKIIQEQQKQLLEQAPSLMLQSQRQPISNVQETPTVSYSTTYSTAESAAVTSVASVERETQDTATQFDVVDGVKEEKTTKFDGKKEETEKKMDLVKIWKGKVERYSCEDVQQTYVRGRGRGRYVCERCGIRCRKPSMLHKHMRSHSNIRPFACNLCMISFKTKGNLTKHSKSKAHFKRLAEVGNKSLFKRNSDKNDKTDDDEENRLVIDEQQEPSENGTLSDEETKFDLDENGLSDEHTFASDDIESGESDSDEFQGFLDERIRPSSVAGRRAERDYVTPTRECASAPPVTACPSVPRIQRRKLLSRAARRRLLEMIGRRVSETESEDYYGNVPSTSSSHVKIDVKTSPTLLLPISVTGAVVGTSTDELSAFLKADEQNTHCELCGKDFRKTAELRLHMQVHYYEQSNRKYVYECSHCRTSFRSKAQLSKHTAASHPGLQNCLQDSPVKERDYNGDVKSGGSNKGLANQASSAPASSLRSGGTNPRPYECADCGTAFRIQGHLAKHLRSKLHVMKLEMQGKLPIGTFAKIESSQVSLSEVETDNCDTTLRSLKTIADRLKVGSDESTSLLLPPGARLVCNRSPSARSPISPRSQFSPIDVVSLTPNSSAPVPVPPLAPPPPSLMCEEQMAPSPPPPAPPAHPTVQTPKIAPMKEERVSPLLNPRKDALQPKSLFGPSPLPMGGNDTPATAGLLVASTAATSAVTATCSVNSKFIVADTWVPPKGGDMCNEVETKPIEPVTLLAPTTGAQQHSVKLASKTQLLPLAPTKIETIGNSSRPEKKVDKWTPAGPIRPVPKEVSAEEATPAKCPFCQQHFKTKCDLDIHLHTDHIAIRDGADFRCPRPNCGKLVPNKTSLRQHVQAHFYGLLANSNNGSTSTESGSSFEGPLEAINRETVQALQRKIQQPAAAFTNGTHAALEGNSGDSRASASRTKYKTHLVKLNSIPEATGNELVYLGHELKSVTGAPCDSSPISDSEASRGSSSQSVSPSLTPHSSHAQTAGGITAGRPVMKRKYEDQCSPSVSLAAAAKHRPVTTPDNRRCSSALDSNRSGSVSGHEMPSPHLAVPRAHPPGAVNSPTLQGLQAMQHHQRLTSAATDVNWINYNNLMVNGTRQMQGLAQMQMHPALLAAALGMNNANGVQSMLAQNGAHAGVGQLAQAQAQLARMSSPEVRGQADQRPSPMTNGYSPTQQQQQQQQQQMQQGQQADQYQQGLLCALCGRRFASSMALQEHLLSHVTERPWVCDRCDAGFTNHNALRAHMTTHQRHNDDPGPRKAGHKQLNI